MKLRSAFPLLLGAAVCALQPAPASATLPDPPLPYVDAVQIGPPAPDTICARLPIVVTLRGTFPDPCHVLKEVQVFDRIMAPFPHPPTVRIVVTEDVCPQHGCATVMTPWSASVTIPGLPPGGWQLPLEVLKLSRDCSGIEVPGELLSAQVPFYVSEPCPPAKSCFVADWDHSRRGTDFCDAFVGVGHPASVTLEIGSMVALAGLQGGLSLAPAGLRIVALEPVGPAAGMHLVWNTTPEGARFAMFAESGAPIPAVLPSEPQNRVPVLKITAALDAGLPAPPLTHVMALDLLGSDANGGSVQECPILYLDPERLIAPAAIICAGAPTACDFNGDGRADVRDLVLMIHCVLQSGFCPPDATGRLDCDQDGRVSIEDVLCCARTVLRGTSAGSPPGRREPGVAVRFGAPVTTPAGLDVPVRVRGTDHLGGALLELRFPSDRFELTGIDGPGPGDGWLSLHDVADSRLAIGLIEAGQPAGATALDLVVHLALKPGQNAGGELRIAGGEFSGPDGAALEVALDSPPLRLEGPAGLALSPGEPNPFAREVRFTVSLARAADVEIAVHDLGGRLVTVIHRGPLGPGPHPFTWNGARADGSAAPGGLYFYRARGGGEVAMRKIILVR